MFNKPSQFNSLASQAIRTHIRWFETDLTVKEPDFTAIPRCNITIIAVHYGKRYESRCSLLFRTY